MDHPNFPNLDIFKVRTATQKLGTSGKQKPTGTYVMYINLYKSRQKQMTKHKHTHKNIFMRFRGFMSIFLNIRNIIKPKAPLFYVFHIVKNVNFLTCFCTLNWSPGPFPSLSLRWPPPFAGSSERSREFPSMRGNISLAVACGICWCFRKKPQGFPTTWDGAKTRSKS